MKQEVFNRKRVDRKQERRGKRSAAEERREVKDRGHWQATVERTVPRTSQLGLDAVKLGVPSVWSVWVGVDSDRLSGGE